MQINKFNCYSESTTFYSKQFKAKVIALKPSGFQRLRNSKRKTFKQPVSLRISYCSIKKRLNRTEKNKNNQYEIYSFYELTIFLQKKQVASAISTPSNLAFLTYLLERNPLTVPIIREQMKFKILIVFESSCFFICCSNISEEFYDSLVQRRLGTFSRFCIVQRINFEILYQIIKWQIVIGGQKKLLFNHFIENNFISSKMAERSTKRPTTVKAYQYDDWICLMCQNLNYSFRKTCNRCRVQTKQNNDYLLQFYNTTAYLALNYCSQETKSSALNPEKESSAYGEHSFPKCLFLELSGDEEDETPLIRRETPEQETPRWINCLIGE